MRAPWTVRVAACLTLPGDWNRWLPRWLGWLPNVTIEGPSVEPEAA